jgi:hypothetical protein
MSNKRIQSIDYYHPRDLNLSKNYFISYVIIVLSILQPLILYIIVINHDSIEDWAQMLHNQQGLDR